MSDPIRRMIGEMLGWSAPELIEEVADCTVRQGFPAWLLQVGVTDDEPRRRREHGWPTFWRSWQTATPSDARFAERTLLSPVFGLRGGTGGNTDGTALYVYVLPEFAHLYSDKGCS